VQFSAALSRHQTSRSRVHVRTSTFLLIGLALSSCRRAEPARDTVQRMEYEASSEAIAALPACAPSPVPDSAWPRIELGPFSLQLPPGYVRREAQGIDSYVGRFAANGRTLGFDFGNHSSSLSSWGHPEWRDYQACRERIGGHLARLVTARRDSLYLAGAAWREVSGSGRGADHLTISVVSSDSLAQTEAA
jgi:hypothetical protein